MLENQELYCHSCNNYVQFDIDVEVNGNNVIKCPSCGHEHCRVVKDGIITSDRWDSRNAFSSTVTNITYTTSSTYTTYVQNNNVSQTDMQYFLYKSWTNSGQNGTNSSDSYDFSNINYSINAC